MSTIRKRRSQPIVAFQIPSGGHSIKPEDWAAMQPNAVWYGVPQSQEYLHPSGGIYTRSRVEAFAAGEVFLGYLPLPSRYANAWTQLCYTVVYWMSEWQAWVSQLGRRARVRRQPASFIQDSVNNTGARFLQYLIIRRLIIDELLRHEMSQDETDQLLIFDEYLIRERFDWLWCRLEDVPEHQLGFLQADPVHEDNRAVFSWQNPKLFVPPEMIVPKTSPAHTWIWGRINHFDFERRFNESFPNVLRFYRSRTLRDKGEEVCYRASAEGFPTRWHEGRQPAVRFLTNEEDHAFNHLRAPAVRSLSAPRSPPGAQSQAGPLLPQPEQPEGSSAAANKFTGIVDDVVTRQVINSFAQTGGGINLAEAHERLQTALGPRYDAAAWGKLLTVVDSEPGEEPQLSVEEAFRLYGGSSEKTAGHAEIMAHYRNEALARV